MTKQTLSIRNRLLLVLVATIATTWLIGATNGYLDAKQEVIKLFDAQLAQSAKVILSLSTHELEEQRIFVGDQPLHEAISQDMWAKKGSVYEHKIALQIWADEDTLAAKTEDSPDTPLMAHNMNGFADTVLNGQLWRVYSITDPATFIEVQMGESYAIREQLIAQIASKVLIPAFVVLPILAAMIWLAIGRALSPLNKITRQVMQRKPLHLEPIEVEQAPLEITPLIDALNQLLLRLQSAFENERRFTGDAAHEIRTPLAGIKTQAQVALRATDERSKENALKQLILAVDRTSHLVQQMLTLERIDPEVGIEKTGHIDLGQITSDVIAEIAPMAIKKGIDISLDGNQNVFIDGNPSALSVLVRNLVENAIKYTPNDGTVNVTLGNERKSIFLSVADSGPGIPVEERDRVLERFYRPPGNQQSGSGLGFSIVKRITELHHATLTLNTAPQGGLEAIVIFSE